MEQLVAQIDLHESASDPHLQALDRFCPLDAAESTYSIDFQTIQSQPKAAGCDAFFVQDEHGLPIRYFLPDENSHVTVEIDYKDDNQDGILDIFQRHPTSTANFVGVSSEGFDMQDGDHIYYDGAIRAFDNEHKMIDLHGSFSIDLGNHLISQSGKPIDFLNLENIQTEVDTSNSSITDSLTMPDMEMSLNGAGKVFTGIMSLFVIATSVGIVSLIRDGLKSTKPKKNSNVVGGQSKSYVIREIGGAQITIPVDSLPDAGDTSTNKNRIEQDGELLRLGRKFIEEGENSPEFIARISNMIELDPTKPMQEISQQPPVSQAPIEETKKAPKVGIEGKINRFTDLYNIKKRINQL